MDWTRAIREECEALKRIVALLSALADLADMTCQRPTPTRGFVLWLLRLAERVAWRFVTGDCPIIDQRNPVESREEAVRLAASFRYLASELVGQMEDLAMLALDEHTESGAPQRHTRTSIFASMSAALLGTFGTPLQRMPLVDTS